MKNIPRWIHPEIQCDWCDSMMPVDTIEIKEIKVPLGIKEVLQVWYQCTEDKCRCMKDLGRPARFGINYEESSETWRKFLEKQKEEEKAKPDDTVVPIAEEAKVQE